MFSRNIAEACADATNTSQSDTELRGVYKDQMAIRTQEIYK